MKNGWKRLAIIAGSIVAFGGAMTVMKDYVPWAPRITFAIAAENKLVRLESNLITLLTLEAQAKAAKDWDGARRLQELIIVKEREIKELEEKKAKYE